MEEECEYGLPSGTCFTVRRLEVVAVAGLLRIYFVVCLFSVCWDFVCFFRSLYFERTRPTTSTRQPCLMYLSTSTGVRTGCHYLICLSVCMSVCVCVTFVVFTECESCTRPISTNPGSMEAREYGLTRGTCFRHDPSRVGRGRRAAVDFVVRFGWGGIFCCFFVCVFFLRTHTACCKYEVALPYLPLY